MDNPYSLILKAFEISDIYLNFLKKTDINDFKYTNLFVSLILLENLIDKQRTLVMPESAEKFPQEKADVEKRLNNLRAEISNIVSILGPQKTKETLYSLGEGIKINFIKNN